MACLVVVGLSAAAVLWQTRGGAHQPATERPLPHRQSGRGHDERVAGLHLATEGAGEGDPVPATWLPAPPPAPQPGPAPPPPGVLPARPHGGLRRLRAAASLLLILVLIGTLVAAALGAAAALTAFALREAVK